MESQNIRNNNEPLFFLFTCVKNGKKYISRLFESLLAQSKINFIHYIYEDGSDEPLGEVLNKYVDNVAKLKTPYKVIYEKNDKNIGLNMSTKHCISKCSCLYFIWIDCDNWIDKNFFKNLEICARKNNYPLFLRSINFKTREINNKLIPSKKIINRNSFKPKIARFSFYFANTTPYHYSFFAVRSDKFFELSENNIIDNKLYFNDEQVLSYCYLYNQKCFATAKKSFGYQLVYDESVSKSTMSEHQNEIYETKRKNRLNLFQKRNPKEYQKLLLYYELDKKMSEAYSFYISANYKEMKKTLVDVKSFADRNNLNRKVFIPTKVSIKLYVVYRFRFFQYLLKKIRFYRQKD